MGAWWWWCVCVGWGGAGARVFVCVCVCVCLGGLWVGRRNCARIPACGQYATASARAPARALMRGGAAARRCGRVVVVWCGAVDGGALTCGVAVVWCV